LGGQAHCPVIGVCLPLAALRRLARKVLGGEPVTDDYVLHCSIVAESKHRNAMAEAVQRELDRRFMIPLRRAATIKCTEALALWWREQGGSNDLPGALWSTLTHARCTPVLEHQVLGQVHMLQHQVGMATRVELARFEALIDENAVLGRALAAAQQRSLRVATEHAERVAALQSALVLLRGQRLAADTGMAMLREDLNALRAAVPALESRHDLKARNAQLAERILGLQRELQSARSEIERLGPARAADATDATSSPRPLPTVATDPVLDNRTVVCVGGRTASVPVYRRLVEACGGRFLHHDGGEEHNPSQLESTLAAADLVICQTGCVSHNAYWRVKDHCKRSGKRCVFVEAPSAAGLKRALAEIDSPR